MKHLITFYKHKISLYYLSLLDSSADVSLGGFHVESWDPEMDTEEDT